MKVALYARVSKDEMTADGRLQNTDNQLEPMRAFCNAMGWEISAEFVDRVSGGTSDRPGFQAMLGRVRQRHFELILVWALDRFSREGMSNTLSYLKQLKEYRTALKSMQESWLDTRQEGFSELLLGIMAWVAEEERKRLAARIKAGIARKRAAGSTWGRPKKHPPQ